MSRTSRLLSGAAAAAVAVTALTVTTTAPAAATADTRSYSCDFPVLGTVVDVPLEVTVPPLLPEVPTGFPVPAGTVPVDAVLTTPSTLLTTALLLLAGGSLAGHTNSFEMGIGDRALPADLRSPLTGFLPTDDLTLGFSGGAEEFVVPEPGDHPLTLPESFDFALLNALGVSMGTVPCTLQGGDAGNVGTMHVVKQRSAMNALVLNGPVREGQRAHMLVAVTNQLGKGAAGRVQAMSGGKQVGVGSLKSGTAKLKLSKLSIGQHQVKLVYLGDKTTKPAIKRVQVRVKPQS